MDDRISLGLALVVSVGFMLGMVILIWVVW